MEKQSRSDYSFLLDANEMNFDPSTLTLDWTKIKAFNRYPDTDSLKLKSAICKELNRKNANYDLSYQYKQISPEQLILGTGSDEILKLILEGLTDKGNLTISPDPSFSEYEKLTGLVQGELVKVPCVDFKVDIDALIKAQNKFDARVIFLANPNNPTGELISKQAIETLLLQTDAWVVVDEAYAEFSEETAIGLLEKYERLLITRTLSKAYGLASLRIGYLIANESVIQKLSPFKMTYNITGVSELITLEVLKNTSYSDDYIAGVKKLRKNAMTILSQIKGIIAFPSEANFILLQLSTEENYRLLKAAFEKSGIKVRYFKNASARFEDNMLSRCIRITLTTEDEFMFVVNVLKEVLK